ncbi:MAG: hypothetical protein U0414_33570 [Polyangiaceae bacterium]
MTESSVAQAGDAPVEASEDSSTHDDAKRIRRNRAISILSFLPWGIGFGCVLAAALTRRAEFLAPLFHLTIFGAVAFFGIRRWNPAATWQPAKVTAGPEGIRSDGVLVAPRERIKSAFITPYKGHTAVRITLKGSLAPDYIAVGDVAEGRRMLRALGLDASQSVAHMKALSEFFRMPAWKSAALVIAPMIGFFALLAGTISLFGKQAAPWALGFMPAMMAFLAGIMLNPTKIEVGADGILTEWFGKKRWFSYADLEFVGPYEDARMGKVYIGVELGLRSGERVQLSCGQKRWGDENQALILERISEAIETYKSGIHASDASILGRNGRAPTDWITSLRRLGAGANADMRTAPIALDRLWRLVEDASASAVSRVGAAIALSPHIDERERKRIRVAAGSTASPKLRVALEKASTPDASEQELAEILSDIESDTRAVAS